MKVDNTQFQAWKLYQCSYYSFLLYPNVAAAQLAATAGVGKNDDSPLNIRNEAEFWSKRIKASIGFVEANTPFVVLSWIAKEPTRATARCSLPTYFVNKVLYVQILVGENVGWIICRDYIEFDEMA